ncbi:alanine racemase [Kosmotoga arenicorallina S304]|uniref:Alanine racemase n=1 Tax=Kosmotoga arenicorallina S304 TaxID=1453497 RepID=A0A176K122_9BACT|nr:LacI family DNA-binding transcriptional regulator [Kosmotoga arenicorallina]OAA30737.1 alanine racemase [Kosmotoga arenicorallina S304]
MVTIKEVAKEAGVSIATVSRVINGSTQVSEEKRKRVLKAMQKLGYKPRPSYRKNSELFGTIGVVLPNLSAYHYPNILTGIYEKAFNKGYDVMVALAKDRPMREKEILDEYFNRKVDGVLVCTLKCDEHFMQKFIDSGIPVVGVDYPVEEVHIDSVNIDNIMGAYAAMRYLSSKGHRKIFYIRGTQNVYASRDREKGIAKYLQRHKEVEVIMSKIVGFDPEDGYEAVMRYFNSHANITAIFCANDYVALGAVKALSKLGLKVPDDISVMGFDDSPFASFVIPSLTTVRQPREEMGSLAAQLLIERLEASKNSIYRNVVLPTEIVERESVKALERQ